MNDEKRTITATFLTSSFYSKDDEKALLTAFKEFVSEFDAESDESTIAVKIQTAAEIDDEPRKMLSVMLEGADASVRIRIDDATAPYVFNMTPEGS